MKKMIKNCMFSTIFIYSILRFSGKCTKCEGCCQLFGGCDASHGFLNILFTAKGIIFFFGFKWVSNSNFLLVLFSFKTKNWSMSSKFVKHFPDHFTLF